MRATAQTIRDKAVHVPLRSVQRKALKQAIKDHSATVETLDKVREARALADSAVSDARNVLQLAEETLIEAKANEGAYLAARALNEAPSGPSLAETEDAVTRARNDVTVAIRTREALDERHERQLAEIERMKRAVDASMADVIRIEMPVADLVARTKQLHVDLINARVVLRHLQRQGWIPDAHVLAVRSLLWDCELPSGLGGVEFRDWNVHPAATAVAEAAERLRADADAPLPQG